MPVDSNKFGSQSKMSTSGSGGGSSTGSCTSVCELRVDEDQKSGSSGICSLTVDTSPQTGIISDEFDAAIEESMEMLEKNGLAGDVVVTVDSDDDDMKQFRHSRRSSSSCSASSTSGATTPSTEEETLNVRLSEEDIDKKLALFNQNIQCRSPEGRFHNPNQHVSFPVQPTTAILPPTRFERYSVVTGRRRLSQCKEEENEEEDSGAINSALVALKKSTSLNTDSATEGLLDCSGGPENQKMEDEVKVTPPSRFIVTKTQNKDKPEAVSTPLKPGVEALLRNSTAKQNSQTIHFPCSTPVQKRVSVQTMFEPHLDKRYFDSSLVEIRSLNDSTQTVNEESNVNDSTDGGSNDIWVKRAEKSKAAPTEAVDVSYWREWK